MTPPATSHSAFHAPVLVHEVVELLGHAEHVLDCTLGGGGHALALLERGARITGVDRDPEAIVEARERLAAFAEQGLFRALQSNFEDVTQLPALEGERFEGILIDLGVSGHQLDDERRGFTFRPNAPLDMRMNEASDVDARQLLNESDEGELERVFREYGDSGRHALRLAREIVRRRQRHAFQTSDDLVNAIRAVLGPRSGPSEFAPIFQAVRIAVNDELTALDRALPSLRDRLTPRGTLAVIAYHSGEDRIVKRAFRDWSASCICPPRQPLCTCRGRPLGEKLTRKAVGAGPAEIATNSRARSAHLRAWRSAA